MTDQSPSPSVPIFLGTAETIGGILNFPTLNPIFVSEVIIPLRQQIDKIQNQTLENPSDDHRYIVLLPEKFKSASEGTVFGIRIVVVPSIDRPYLARDFF